MTTQQKIVELEKQQELLNKQLEELKTECNKEIKLEGGEWYILGDGKVKNYKSTPECLNFGIERKTKELTERASNEMRISNRLRARRDEIESDWVDKSIGTTAWYIFKDKVEYSISWDMHSRDLGTVYMSEQTAIQICEELNSGRFKL